MATEADAPPPGPAPATDRLCTPGARAFFERPDGLGNWLCVVERDGGGWTRVDSGVVAGPVDEHRFRIAERIPGTGDNAGGFALFFIDNVLVANIPTTEART